MRIAFVIPSLGPGGAERVATLLCNFWAAQDHKIILATFETTHARPFHRLDDAIEVRDLEIFGGCSGVATKLTKNLHRVLRLRSLVREFRPDAVVAFTTDANVVTLCACYGLGVPVVISERNQPDRPGLGRVHKLARRICYPFADCMVVQTNAIAAWVETRFRIPVLVIPNPVLPSLAAKDQSRGACSERFYLIAVGRLTHQKGFDVLIQSFAAVATKHPDWCLTIYGEGPERPRLERLRKSTGLYDRVALPGLIEDVSGPLREASLFVHCSRFEGYPNTLLEALASGLPVVATDCPGGTAEILANGSYGILVPPDDVSAMAAALDSMMSNPDRRSHFAHTARDAVVHLGIAHVGTRWLDLLVEISI